MKKILIVLSLIMTGLFIIGNKEVLAVDECNCLRYVDNKFDDLPLENPLGNSIYDLTVGKNLFDLLDTSGTGLVYTRVSENVFTIYASSSIGVASTNIMPQRLWLSNTQYTFSGSSYENDDAKNTRLRIYYTDGTNTDLFNPTLTNTTFSTTSTVGKTIEKVVFTYSASGGTTTITDFMIEQGSTSTTYEPYNVDTYLGRPLNKVGTIEDTQSMQYVGLYNTLNSDFLNFVTTYTNLDSVDLVQPINSLNYGNTSDIFATLEGFNYGLIISDLTTNKNYFSPSYSSVRFRLFLEKGLYASLAEVQSALSGIDLYYQLATPIANTRDIYYYNYNADIIINITEAYGETYPSKEELDIIFNETLGEYFIDAPCEFEIVNTNNNLYLYDDDVISFTVRDYNKDIDLDVSIKKYDLEGNYIGLIGMWQDGPDDETVDYTYFNISLTIPDITSGDGYIYTVEHTNSGELFTASVVLKAPDTIFRTVYGDMRTAEFALGFNNSVYETTTNSEGYLFDGTDPYMYEIDTNGLGVLHYRFRDINNEEFVNIRFYNENGANVGIVDLIETQKVFSFNYIINPLTINEGWFYIGQGDATPYIYDFINTFDCINDQLLDLEAEYMTLHHNRLTQDGIYTLSLDSEPQGESFPSETPIYYHSEIPTGYIINPVVDIGYYVKMIIRKTSEDFDDVYNYQYVFNNNDGEYYFDELATYKELNNFALFVSEGNAITTASLYTNYSKLLSWENGASNDAYTIVFQDYYTLSRPAPVVETVENWFDSVGLQSTVSKLILSIVIMFIITFAITRYTTNLYIIILSNFILMVVMTVFGLLPLYVILVFVILIIGIMFLYKKSDSGGVE